MIVKTVQTVEIVAIVETVCVMIDQSSGRLISTKQVMTASKKDLVLTTELKGNTRTKAPTRDAMAATDGGEAKTRETGTPSIRLLNTAK